jgi:hypothetical protein
MGLWKVCRGRCQVSLLQLITRLTSSSPGGMCPLESGGVKALGTA